MVTIMNIHLHDAIVRYTQQFLLFVAVEFDDKQSDTVFRKTLPALDELQFRFDEWQSSDIGMRLQDTISCLQNTQKLLITIQWVYWSFEITFPFNFLLTRGDRKSAGSMDPGFMLAVGACAGFCMLKNDFMLDTSLSYELSANERPLEASRQAAIHLAYWSS